MIKMFFYLLILALLSFGGSVIANERATNHSESFNNSIEQKEVQMEQRNATPEYLYRIISFEDWKKSQLQDQIVTSPLDKDFIHLATEEQLPHIAQKFWHNKGYVILKLAANKLIGQLKYETNPGGSTRYYHLYDGKIPLDAVVGVSIINIGGQGRARTVKKL